MRPKTGQINDCAAHRARGAGCFTGPARPHTVTDAFFESLRGQFSDDEIVEMVFACGIFNWGNKINITMNLDSSEESEYATGVEYRQEEIA